MIMLIQDQFVIIQNLQTLPIPQTSFLVGTFFADSYSKTALKTFKKFKISTSSHEPRPQSNADVNINFKWRVPVRFLKYKSTPTDEGNPFQFHDFFQIYSLHFRVQTSAVQRFHEKTKQNTHARWPQDKKYWCAFAEFLQNIYRNNLLQKYRNLSSFNYFSPSKHITTISKSFCFEP